MATLYTGKVYLSTYWHGQEIASLVLRHRRANKRDREERKEINDVPSYQRKIYVMDFQYEEFGIFNPWPDFDYWWMMLITKDGHVYTVKDDFYCNITSNDGGEVYISINNKIETEWKMLVDFPYSNGDWTYIKEIGG
ncbi:hypothetical protein [Xenorhabdus cabanillasii]|uniref:Uncharacterized protein n=1 Tax=Xenorhabdus cabanillasii JM26 TaxID=1427517 RepID=W1J5S6_9GAMM|nr:hypothetical protein [Xenorhabdus cabanillasii]PHM76909.1 hypothetical protein Xcab_02476 [Xenorhabdus cabanillasii JM26]CDL85211.1 conserved hypothetical protein [Xenorhabdus cabanillasii JM26]